MIFWPFYPFLITAWPILNLFAVNAKRLALVQLYAPLIVSEILTLCLFLIIARTRNSVYKAAQATALTAFMFFSYAHLAKVFDRLWQSGFGNSLDNRIFLFVYLAIYILCLVTLLESKSAPSKNSTLLLNIISISVCSLPIAMLMGHISFTQSVQVDCQPTELSISTPTLAKPYDTAVPNKPDIYYIIVDGMANERIQKERYNLDCSKFSRGLRELGFYVAPDSMSNYQMTFLSLASSLNMSYLNVPAKYRGTTGDDRAWTFKAIEDNAFSRFVKTQGYHLVRTSSSWAITDSSEKADFLYRKHWLNDFVVDLLLTTPLKTLESGTHFILNDTRQQRLDSINAISKLVHQPSPKFVFIHLLIPHPPFVFHSDGSAPYDTNVSIEGEDWFDSQSYKEQVIFLEQQLLRKLKQLVKDTNGKAIIILQADHGPASSLEYDSLKPTSDYLDERMHIFNAYYLPSNPSIKPWPTITPVNSFRLVLNDYFGTKLPFLKDECFFSTYQSPYTLYPITKEKEVEHPAQVQLDTNCDTTTQRQKFNYTLSQPNTKSSTAGN